MNATITHVIEIVGKTTGITTLKVFASHLDGAVNGWTVPTALRDKTYEEVTGYILTCGYDRPDFVPVYRREVGASGGYEHTRIGYIVLRCRVDLNTYVLESESVSWTRLVKCNATDPLPSTDRVMMSGMYRASVMLNDTVTAFGATPSDAVWALRVKISGMNSPALWYSVPNTFQALNGL